jgi:hypothetical protein
MNSDDEEEQTTPEKNMDMDISPEHVFAYQETSMMSPEHASMWPVEETVMGSPIQHAPTPTPWEKENSMLDCAMIMTRHCERERTTHFRGPTGSQIPYIVCCAYTAPTMTVAVMFLEHFEITSTEKLDDRLTHQQLLGPDKKTPLAFKSVCSGINEVMGNMWSHHYRHNVGIDAWLSRDELFESRLDPGVNMVSFVDVASNLTVHHAFIYVSQVDRATCYIVDSWCSNDMCRDLVKRQHTTDDVVAALNSINIGIDPSDIMLRVFLDPVEGGSCHDQLRVVKLKKSVVQGIIDTMFPAGFKGFSRFGGKSKAASRKQKASSKAASRKQKALSKASSKAASRKSKSLRKRKALSKALSRRKNNSRRLR